MRRWRGRKSKFRQLPSVKPSNSPSTSLERVRVGVNLTLALACVVGGAVVLTALVATRPAPPQRQTAARPLAVAVETVVPCVETSPVVGYGTVRPKHEVDIIPQVSGKLVFAHDDLAVGKTIAAGETLFEIDQALYQSRVAQAEAEKRRLEAVRARYDVDAATLDERVIHAERLLALAQEQYGITQALYADEENAAATALEVSADEQRLIKQQDALAELRSRREMIPHLKAENEAMLEAAEAQLERARLELAHTKIVCPFDARVESVSVYTSQVVTAFFAIARLTSLEAFEISVGIDPRELTWLAQAAQPDTLTQEAHQPSAEVVVRSTVRGVEFEWRGYVSRFERMDESTRTPAWWSRCSRRTWWRGIRPRVPEARSRSGCFAGRSCPRVRWQGRCWCRGTRSTRTPGYTCLSRARRGRGWKPAAWVGGECPCCVPWAMRCWWTTRGAKEPKSASCGLARRSWSHLCSSRSWVCRCVPGTCRSHASSLSASRPHPWILGNSPSCLDPYLPPPRF